MRTTTLAARSLWTHKRRLVGAFIAVFLGVAFLAGTLIVSDTLAASSEKIKHINGEKPWLILVYNVWPGC